MTIVLNMITYVDVPGLGDAPAGNIGRLLDVLLVDL